MKNNDTLPNSAATPVAEMVSDFDQTEQSEQDVCPESGGVKISK